MKRAAVVLVAEDDEDDWFLTKRVLNKAGVAPVFHASDGKDAMDYLAGVGSYADREQYPLPDLLLLDLKMPLFTGHQVLEWMQTQPALRDIKVYVLTSSDESRDRHRVEQAGAAGYLVKPLTLAHLMDLFPDESASG